MFSKRDIILFRTRQGGRGRENKMGSAREAGEELSAVWRTADRYGRTHCTGLFRLLGENEPGTTQKLQTRLDGRYHCF